SIYFGTVAPIVYAPIGGISFPKPSVYIVGSNTSSIVLSPSSNQSGQYSLRVTQSLPIRFFIEDQGFNGSNPVPSGINVKISLGAKSYDIERVSEIFANGIGPTNSSNPLISTTGLARMTVNYTIQMANTVPPGQYTITIVCLSFPNPNVSSPNPQATFEVSLKVA